MSEYEHRNPAVRGSFDPETGVATLTLDMEGKVNVINEAFGLGLKEALDWAKGQTGLKGIIVDSAHKDFCAGADIDTLFDVRDAAEFYARVKQLSGLYRELESSGVPVVCVLEGTALGGGYELALSCHHRIAVDDPRIKVGLPEVQLGVIPGAGGTQRLPRLIGIQPALEAILQAKEFRAPKALKAGFVDALAADGEAAHAAAREWIAANPKAVQPWDKKGAKIPGPQPGSSDARNMFMAGAAMLRKKTAGVFPGPERALSAVEEGLALTIDGGLDVEARYFTELAISDQCKDMIRTLWYGRNAAMKHEGLPSTDAENIERGAMLDSGMMGAGLAFVSAQAGYEVWLKDIKQEALDAGVAHFDKQLAKRGKHLSEAERQAIRARLHPTLELGEMKDIDLVIEAVFENLELKHRVNSETEPCLSDRGIWASNTSALPISDLATSSKRAEKFIGLHFFSPVEQMPLLEIIMGEKTDDETLARCLTYCKRIKKIPIVVGDAYGFYTTRVFSSYILEGAQLVAEGHDPVLIEWAAKQAGMVVPPLQVFDEVTLSLGVKAMKSGAKYQTTPLGQEGLALLTKMVDDLDRQGRAAGAGFFEYENGKRKRLWPGLADLAAGKPETTGVEYITDRLMLVQANTAAHAVEQGIIKKPRDADVGGIFGIGFAPNTGGPLVWLDRLGAKEAVKRLDHLAQTAGPRYEPPKLLRDMAESGKKFYE